MRAADGLAISLVAQVEGTVAGHIAFSRVVISDGSRDWYGLGPLSVLPSAQGKGVGKALVNAGMAALKANHARGCVVLGEPAYYRRFGFTNAPRLSLAGVAPEYFMSISFDADHPAGTVAYHEAFAARG
jgi:putative acetyltransferase